MINFQYVYIITYYDIKTRGDNYVFVRQSYSFGIFL